MAFVVLWQHYATWLVPIEWTFCA